MQDLLGREGWRVNHKPLRLVWREEGLKAPQTLRKSKGLDLQNLGLFASNRRARTKCGVWILFLIERRMAGQSRCWWCWMNTRGKILRL